VKTPITAPLTHIEQILKGGLRTPPSGGVSHFVLLYINIILLSIFIMW